MAKLKSDEKINAFVQQKAAIGNPCLPDERRGMSAKTEKQKTAQLFDADLIFPLFQYDLPIFICEIF